MRQPIDSSGWTRARWLAVVLLLAAGLSAVSSAAGGSVKGSLVIRHQVRGCHSWSLNDGPVANDQVITIASGGSLLVMNDDVMPHLLKEISGHSVRYTRVSLGAPMGGRKFYPPAMLARIGASSLITFSKRGDYRFTTTPSAAYMPNLVTVGPDNILRLTVHVR